MVRQDQNHDLAQVIRNFFPELNATHKLPEYKLKTLEAIKKCRTEYMGGHIEVCEDCGDTREAFNSCRNRHCPKCGAIDKEKWILKRQEDLLPVRYFHVVFTVPDGLNVLFMNNQVAMYNLLFYVVWDVIKDFGKTKKWIGGKAGVTAILHTAGQNLHYHPHLHLIVPAGALMPGNKWKHARQRGKYLFKVDHLSDVFRARFMKQTRLLKKTGRISGKIPINLFDKNWVVYAKPAFGNPEQVISYLGRYTHRTAISNNRILHVDQEKVTFTWKDYHRNYARRTTAINGKEFLRLFCMHILPPKFTRIRHYGFLSSASKTKSLAIIRANLKAKPVKNHDDESRMKLIFKKMGITPGICKLCGGKMVTAKTLPNFFKNGREPPQKVSDLELMGCIDNF